MTPRMVTAGAHGRITPGRHGALAVRIADHARRNGFTIEKVEASRCGTSPSRYIRLRDALGRLWLLRVSNHGWRPVPDRPVPHLDIRSIDGTSGLDEAIAYLADIQAGLVTWRDPQPPTPEKRRWA